MKTKTYLVFALDLGVEHPNDQMFFDTPEEVADALRWLRNTGHKEPVAISANYVLKETA